MILKQLLRSLFGRRPDARGLEQATASAEAGESLAAALHDRGIALLLEGRAEDAIGAYRRLVAMEPDGASGHANLGAAYRMRGDIDAAVGSFREALRLNPGSADALGNLGSLLSELGLHAEAEQAFRSALALAPGKAATHSSLLLSLNYRDDVSPERLFDEHRAWAAQHAPGASGRAEAHANARSPERPLRVGYVSADFKRHSVAYFSRHVLAAHDPMRFRVFCYADLSRGDDVTQQFRGACAEWRDIFRIPDDAVAELVRRDGIDILVDLAGHTGANRLRVFARKPAPVQATWLGYPNTTGLEAMDYRLTDGQADPAGQTERFHTEKLVRLDGGFLCYAPPEECPDIAAPPSPASGAVTFGSFNNLAKLSPHTIALWSRVLAARPEAKLLLKARGLASPSARQRLAGAFSGHGIDAGRIEFRNHEESPASHLALYGRVDIALDVFPYCGTTTTCEALWMGVPVVSLAGKTHASRVGASLLNQVGLAELACASEEEFVATALGLASQPMRLLALRREMRTRLQASPLLNVKLFTARLERAYRSMWRDWCRS